MICYRKQQYNPLVELINEIDQSIDAEQVLLNDGLLMTIRDNTYKITLEDARDLLQIFNKVVITDVTE